MVPTMGIYVDSNVAVDKPQSEPLIDSSLSPIGQKYVLKRRFAINGRVYEITDAQPDEIKRILARDGEADVSNDQSFRRVTFDRGNLSTPIGFYKAEISSRYSTALDLTFNYVSRDNRSNGLGLVQGIDFLLLALEMEGIDSAVFMPLSGRSRFYDSLGEISRRGKIQGWTEYEIDTKDKDKVKKVLTERLKELGIVAL